MDKYITNNELILYELFLEISEITPKQKLSKNLIYHLLDSSEYFYDYFPYENKNENKKIKYQENGERTNLFIDLA